MSNNAAIAAVTATLTNMIQAAVAADTTVSSGTVTARPPDRARQGAPVNQVNLFLYRTSIDAAWRNQDPPTIRPGESGQPPLPLVLSYLITAYGENDDEILAHRLLGIAMGVLNDRPVLSRAQIASALPPPGSDLAEPGRAGADHSRSATAGRDLADVDDVRHRLPAIGQLRRGRRPDRQHAARRSRPRRC